MENQFRKGMYASSILFLIALFSYVVMYVEGNVNWFMALLAGMVLSFLSYVASSLGELLFKSNADEIEKNWSYVFELTSYKIWAILWVLALITQQLI